MPQIFKRQYDVKLPLPHGQNKHEEYWIEQKGVTQCSRCGNVHYKKQWFASQKDLQKHLGVKSTAINHTRLCYACRMIKNHEFDGEVVIKDIPHGQLTALANTIRNFVAEALQKDPQDRVITTQSSLAGYRVTTTNNETADKLGKKIHQAFQGTAIQYSRAPKPYNIDRIHIIFKEPKIKSA